MSELHSRKAVIDVLRQKGLRVTPQRCAVYANLLSRTDHPTVEQLIKDLNQDLPLSSKATVYSSLQALRDVGLVREVLLEEGVARFDANMEPHHHFRCRSCGDIEDIAWSTFPELTFDALRPGLEPEAYEITVHGVCGKCHQQGTAS